MLGILAKYTVPALVKPLVAWLNKLDAPAFQEVVGSGA